MTPAEIRADRLATILVRHGLDVRRDRSSLSSSRYLYVETDDARIKIRVSDHVARPTYERDHGAAEIEIGAHDMATHHGAMDAAGAVLDRLGVARDAKLRASLAMAGGREAKARRLSEQARATLVDAWKEAKEAAEAKGRSIIAWDPKKWAKIKDLPGKQGKEKRRKFRREAEAALGLTK